MIYEPIEEDEPEFLDEDFDGDPEEAMERMERDYEGYLDRMMP